MPSTESRAYLLTTDQIEWMVEIAASIVRNNLTKQAPKDWRRIPSWWSSAEGAKARQATDPELIEDVEMAVECLQAMWSAPEARRAAVKPGD